MSSFAEASTFANALVDRSEDLNKKSMIYRTLSIYLNLKSVKNKKSPAF